jgi:hypothetical protein
MKNFNIQYNSYIENEVRVPKVQIEPFNIYRISSYVSTDGSIENKSGNNSDLIFVIGTFPTPQLDKKINCLKITGIHPDDFTKWLKQLVDKRKIDNIDELLHLNELLIPTDNTGRIIFERYVKPSTIVYNLSESIYRTYNTSGIRYIQEVFLKKDKLKEITK